MKLLHHFYSTIGVRPFVSQTLCHPLNQMRFLLRMHGGGVLVEVLREWQYGPKYK